MSSLLNKQIFKKVLYYKSLLYVFSRIFYIYIKNIGVNMKRKTHPYNSNAEIEYIYNYEYTSDFDKEKAVIHCLKMPVLIQSDKTLWELGNIYLHHLLIHKSSSQTTLESVANGLLDFLRFMEHSSLDVLHLPDEVHERVTYRYKSALLQRIRLNNNLPNTCRGKISTVIRFYKFCIENEVFDAASLRNIPYMQIKHRFNVTSDYGSYYQVEVLSNDLAIRSTKHHLSSDEILDGGVLRPLNLNEQSLVEIYLKDTASREFQLMCYLALYTGARLQTVSTLRVFNIKGLKDKVPDAFYNAYSLAVGSGSVVDTKNGTRMDLKIPDWLVNELISYIDSQQWKKRAKSSYYGVSDQNYIFLTSRGEAYYTSLKEIEDRRNSKSLRGFKQTRGLSIRPHITQMIRKINKDTVQVNHFRFHDLRATFGLNTLNVLIRCGFAKEHALWLLKERMGHKDITTTIKYLEYSSFTSSLLEVNTSFSEALNNYKKESL